MCKRQAVDSIITSQQKWLFFCFLGILLLTGCSPIISSNLSKVTPPSNHRIIKTPTHSITNTGTPAPTQNSPVSTLSPTTQACQETRGTLQRGQIFSKNLQDYFRYSIYLPPCYQSVLQARFPAVYLLHGLTYTDDQWLDLGLQSQMDLLIAEGEIAPFIIVLPREYPFNPPQTSRFPDALIDDLIPWIDEHYRTLPEQASRGIGGLSRGAAWSVHIGFTHPAHFACVGAHSLPVFAADGGNIERWLTQTPKENLPHFLIDIGRSDPERLTAQDFAERLDENHIPHEWYLFNGGHTYDYWSDHLAFYLRWYARNLDFKIIE